MQSAGQRILLHHCVLEMTSHTGGGDAPIFASPFQMSWGARGHLQSTLQESVHLLLAFLFLFKTPFFHLVIGIWTLKGSKFQLLGLSFTTSFSLFFPFNISHLGRKKPFTRAVELPKLDHSFVSGNPAAPLHKLFASDCISLTVQFVDLGRKHQQLGWFQSCAWMEWCLHADGQLATIIWHR